MNPNTCTHCHDHFPSESLTLFQNQALCPDCLDELTVPCSYCGERIWQSENDGNETVPLCHRCRERHSYVCEECGRLIASDVCYYLDDDEDTPYCSDCVDRLRGRTIQNYYFKPSPMFHGEGFIYFGVELEVDDGGEVNHNAIQLMDIANESGNNLYIKHDGSLEDGFELVTHPMTLDYHKSQMPWAEVLRQAIHMGYFSHQTSTCGLHIHVNRTAFGATTAEQEACIARVLFFVENHWNELLRFSRRTKAQLAKWAARYGRKDSPKEVMDTVKSIRPNRYTCVNLTNTDTIEFRIFRGTLKYNTLIATLELVNELCSVAIFYSDEELADLTWLDFVSRIKPDHTPELITYLKERRLYISEPVESEVER